MFDTILFDLDGTLTNPKEGITKSVQYALNSYGIQNASLDELEHFIGPPLKEQFMIYTGCDDKDGDFLLKKYRERFSVTGIFENEVYEGIPKLLKNLKEKGKTIALATSKPTVYAKQILEHFNLIEYFDLCVGSELDGRRVKKEEVISEVLTLLKPDLSKTVMVGDRSFDIIAANFLGIKSIGVKYGFAGENELEKEKPFCIVSNTEELNTILSADVEVLGDLRVPSVQTTLKSSESTQGSQVSVTVI